MNRAGGTALDHFSTSQTSPTFDLCSSVPRLEWCKYGAPMFAYRRGDENSRAWGVTQGVCNHWDCPRCGPMIAGKNYGRIVEGARELQQIAPLYFLTVTCRGKEIDRADAEANYLKWTNTLLTAIRTRAKREGQHWAYAQVTERQKRGHPHSHILTTWKPHDLVEGKKTNWKRDNGGNLVSETMPALRSAWLHDRCVSAGLGPQYDVSQVQDVEAASRYVAKYLFKDSLLTQWPKHWKRVRYSQTWPQLPEQDTEAFAILGREDWYDLAHLAMVVTVHGKDPQAVHRTCDGLFGHDVFVRVQDTNIQFGVSRAPGLNALIASWSALPGKSEGLTD